MICIPLKAETAPPKFYGDRVWNERIAWPPARPLAPLLARSAEIYHGLKLGAERIHTAHADRTELAMLPSL